MILIKSNVTLIMIKKIGGFEMSIKKQRKSKTLFQKPPHPPIFSKRKYYTSVGKDIKFEAIQWHIRIRNYKLTFSIYSKYHDIYLPHY